MHVLFHLFFGRFSGNIIKYCLNQIKSEYRVQNSFYSCDRLFRSIVIFWRKWPLTWQSLGFAERPIFPRFSTPNLQSGMSRSIIISEWASEHHHPSGWSTSGRSTSWRAKQERCATTVRRSETSSQTKLDPTVPDAWKTTAAKPIIYQLSLCLWQAQIF